MRSPEAIRPANKQEHIVSLVLYCLPSQINAIQQRIDCHDQLTCEVTDNAGKWVLILTAFDDADIRKTLNELEHWPGVLSVALVAHYTGDKAQLDEQLDSTQESSPW